MENDRDDFSGQKYFIELAKYYIREEGILWGKNRVFAGTDIFI